jgi:hypothetical protein
LDSWLARCAPFLAGDGRVEAVPDGARLILPRSSAARYGDAQLDDYAGLPRRRYLHRPPLRLWLRARFSHELKNNHGDTESTEKKNESILHRGGFLLGTAGFGFWNNPFGAQSGLPTLPQAIWFFYASPPSNMALAVDVPGQGWKAACIDAGRRPALALIPVAPLVMLACRAPRLYRIVWPRVQRALGIREQRLALRTTHPGDWHTYALEWRRDGARWQVDGETVLETDRSPRGPLGFVAWIDNQYAVVTPRGELRWGVLDTIDEQWLEVVEVEVTKDE